MAQGSGLSTQEMGTGQLGLCCLRETHQWGLGCRLVSLIPATRHFYVPTSLTPSNPEPIKQVCCSPASWTGRVCKCCLNAPPGKMTPRGLVRLVISSPSPCQETILSSSSILLKCCHLWFVTMDRWGLSHDLYCMANVMY